MPNPAPAAAVGITLAKSLTNAGEVLSWTIQGGVAPSALRLMRRDVTNGAAFAQIVAPATNATTYTDTNGQPSGVSGFVQGHSYEWRIDMDVAAAVSSSG